MEDQPPPAAVGCSWIRGCTRRMRRICRVENEERMWSVTNNQIMHGWWHLAAIWHYNIAVVAAVPSFQRFLCLASTCSHRIAYIAKGRMCSSPSSSECGWQGSGVECLMPVFYQVLLYSTSYFWHTYIIGIVIISHVERNNWYENFIRFPSFERTGIPFRKS